MLNNQLSTLNHIRSAGLLVPSQYQHDNKYHTISIEELFLYENNSETLYNKFKSDGVNYKGMMSTRLDYRDPIVKTKNALNDADFIAKFLTTSKGLHFITKQVFLQGTQAFDETKLYNPLSPVLAAVQPGMFGLLDRPTRHINTSNIVGGLVSGLGVGSLVSGVGSLITGESGGYPAPPRSSVASRASTGYGISTLTSMAGGDSRVDEVVSPHARYDVAGLLRGATATRAYTSRRYSKYIPPESGGILGRLMTAAIGYLTADTVVGSVLNPTQPWDAKYRADEKTYDYMLTSSGVFFPDGVKYPTENIVGSIRNALGFGKTISYTSAIPQRFFNFSEYETSYTRVDKELYNINKRFNTKRESYQHVNQIGTIDFDDSNVASHFTVDDISLVNIQNYVKGNNKKTLRYDDVITLRSQNNEEQSDILYAYKKFTAQQEQITFDALDKLKAEFYSEKKPTLYFKRFLDNVHIPLVSQTDGNIDINKSKNARQLSSHQKNNYINALNPIPSKSFYEKYLSQNDEFGPDIIKFYFYDIVNKIYIPFNATVQNINDNNTAEWQKIEYIGRADKMFLYGGFTRTISFDFLAIAGSVRELMPMWRRINYLVSLTRPANYTLQNAGGAIVPPIIHFTLGDMYKKHFAVLTSVNITIDPDTLWEVVPEEKDIMWKMGPTNYNYISESLQGKVAQFPMSAKISVNMSILEKDRPRAGRSIWGDAPIKINRIENRYIDDVDKLIDGSDKKFSENLHTNLEMLNK